MKKLIAWVKTNPFFAIIGGVAIGTGIVLLLRAIFGGSKTIVETPSTEPTSTQRLGWQRAFRTTPTFSGAGRPAGGVGSTGMGGARVNQGGVAR